MECVQRVSVYIHHVKDAIVSCGQHESAEVPVQAAHLAGWAAAQHQERSEAIPPVA